MRVSRSRQVKRKRSDGGNGAGPRLKRDKRQGRLKYLKWLLTEGDSTSINSEKQRRLLKVQAQ
jgi:hypothetical protein